MKHGRSWEKAVCEPLMQQEKTDFIPSFLFAIGYRTFDRANFFLGEDSPAEGRFHRLAYAMCTNARSAPSFVSASFFFSRTCFLASASRSSRVSPNGGYARLR